MRTGKRKTSQRRSGALLIWVLLAALLAGCAEETPPSAPAPIRPVEMITVGGGALDNALRFPGRVRAAERAELAFEVAGRVVELPVREGQQVKPGQLIARVDAESFNLRLQAAKAEHDNAKAEYERAEQLWEEGIIARAELERKQTALEVARSSLAAAKENVEESRLVAPFAGRITKRHVERFQNVQAKQPIVALQDLDNLEIVIHVPERIVRSAPRRAAAYALFDEAPERRFPVRLSSFAAEADPTTQTFEAVLSFTKPRDFNVLPGMPVTIVPDTAAAPAADEQGEGAEEGAAPVSLPLSALVDKGGEEPFVWVVDPESGAVAKRAVRVGGVSGSEVSVLEGLSPGERVAVSGVHHLREGMRVRPLEN